MDWLRLWTLNGDSAAALGLEPACAPWLDCAPDAAAGRPLLDGPELALAPPPAADGAAGRGKTVLWAGALRRAAQAEGLLAVAARFRTTVKGLLAVNPDQAGPVVPPGADVCVVPCTARG